MTAVMAEQTVLEQIGVQFPRDSRHGIHDPPTEQTTA